jgi:hypothetical protein
LEDVARRVQYLQHNPHHPFSPPPLKRGVVGIRFVYNELGLCLVAQLTGDKCRQAGPTTNAEAGTPPRPQRSVTAWGPGPAPAPLRSTTLPLRPSGPPAATPTPAPPTPAPPTPVR